jgi:hypothetical protein
VKERKQDRVLIIPRPLRKKRAHDGLPFTWHYRDGRFRYANNGTPREAAEKCGYTITLEKPSIEQAREIFHCSPRYGYVLAYISRKRIEFRDGADFN